MKRYLILLVLLMAGAVLFEGFQCASPLMTTAKLARQKKDYIKAEQALNQELTKNPKSGDALFLMALTKLDLYKMNITDITKLKDAAKFINDAEKAVLDPLNSQQVPISKFNIWREAFNEGINNFNAFISSKNNKDLEESLMFFDISLLVRPDNSETYRLKGRAYEAMGNEEKAIEMYNLFAEKIKNEIEFAKNSKIFLDMPRKDVIAKFGNPESTKGDRLSPTDSVLTDIFKISSKDVIVFYLENKQKEMLVYGWKINPPMYLLPDERTQFSQMDANPFAYIANTYYLRAINAKNNASLDSLTKIKQIDYNLNIAKENIKNIILLEPGNVEANRFLIELYNSQGKSQEALQEIEKLVKSEPNNKFYLAQYGELNLRLEKFDDAIDNYKKALAVDPNFCDVLRNLGAAYKNKTVKIIQLQQDKKDKDKNYKEDPDEYLPLLKESAKYFAKSRDCEKYKNDITVLSELANLYLAIDDKDKLNMIIDDLERLEQTISDDDKESYWLKLCKILGDMKSPKSSKACQEAQKYLK